MIDGKSGAYFLYRMVSPMAQKYAYMQSGEIKGERKKKDKDREEAPSLESKKNNATPNMNGWIQNHSRDESQTDRPAVEGNMFIFFIFYLLFFFFVLSFWIFIES